MQMENACRSENEESKATEYTPGLKGEKLKAGWFSWSWSLPCSKHRWLLQKFISDQLSKGGYN